MRNVLLPFDGSAPAKRALQYLVDLSGEYPNVQVHIINVQPDPVLYGSYVSNTLLEQMRNAAVEHAQVVIAEAVSVLKDAAVRTKAHVRVGEAVGEIVQAVRAYDCDTVIMGTRGMNNLGNLFMGSVATRVVHEVPVPVLLVK